MAKLMVQVEHYLDANPRKPEAYARFQKRIDALQSSSMEDWGSIVFDDATWMELAARRYHQYHLNPKAQHPWQWFAGSTDLLEEMLCQTAGALPAIVGVACHVSHEKDEAMGAILRSPSAPGRLKDRQELMSAFSEVYHISVDRVQDEQGNVGYQHRLQTRADGLWAAQTHIEAPNPCEPQWEALWANWEGTSRPLSKVLVYGDPGCGKTTFLSTFPPPVLAFSFDPFGKEIPYLKQGNHLVEDTDDRGTPIRQVFKVPKVVKKGGEKT